MRMITFFLIFLFDITLGWNWVRKVHQYDKVRTCQELYNRWVCSELSGLCVEIWVLQARQIRRNVVSVEIQRRRGTERCNVRWGHDGLLSPEIIQRLDSGEERWLLPWVARLRSWSGNLKFTIPVLVSVIWLPSYFQTGQRCELD